MPEPSPVALSEGMRVRARFMRREKWYPGVVREVQGDGTVTIDYDDGDEEEGVLARHVVLLAAEGETSAKITHAKPERKVNRRPCDTCGFELHPRSTKCTECGTATLRGVADRPCGTPGCMLPDWHSGLCAPLRNICGPRPRQAKRVFEPDTKPTRRSNGPKVQRLRAPSPDEPDEPDDGPSPVWVQCDRCCKWRLLIGAADGIDDRSEWVCEMNPDTNANWCEAPEPTACNEVDPEIAPDMYYVERILDVRHVRWKGWQYLVRWLGWSPEHDSWEPARNIADRSLIREFEQRGPVAPTTTDDIIRLTWAFVAPTPSIGGRGLFARVPLRPGQAIGEYGGPRLPSPMALQTGDGGYVLCVPRTRIVIDGNCDSLPGEYQTPRYACIFANHSSQPNAALEYWPDLLAQGHWTDFELSGSMWIVATEPIDAGMEIRINYEGGAQHYWRGGAPKETPWREARAPAGLVAGSVPRDAAPAMDVLDAIREAADRSRAQQKKPQLPAPVVKALAQIEAEPSPPLPVAAADARIRMLAPLLARTDNRRTWGLLATHVPGWSGRQCHDRWRAMGADRPRLRDQLPAAIGAKSRPHQVASTILRTMQ